MNEERSAGAEERATQHWPAFMLTCTFNPSTAHADRQLDPDEVFIFDPSRSGTDGTTHWITAEEGSYLPLEETQ